MVAVRSSAVGEGLSDLGGQTTPLSDGERRANAAERYFHGNVVAADDQQDAHGGVLAGLVAHVVAGG
jgi:hypothetical protein